MVVSETDKEEIHREVEQEMLAREQLGQETLELERIAMENSSGQTQEKFETLQSQLREVSRERDSLAAENQRLSGSVGRNHARGRRRRRPATPRRRGARQAQGLLPPSGDLPPPHNQFPRTRPDTALTDGRVRGRPS